MTQIETLLKLLNENKIRYVVIGATAFSAHGWTRSTLDLDLYVDPAESNLQLLRKALAEFGYDVSDASLEDFMKFKILFRQYDLPLDIHPKVAGATSFQAIWERATHAKLGEVDVPFVSLPDLIEMKKAAGRPKDLEDLKVLEKLRKTT